jgi:hypothetical protein
MNTGNTRRTWARTLLFSTGILATVAVAGCSGFQATASGSATTGGATTQAAPSTTSQTAPADQTAPTTMAPSPPAATVVASGGARIPECRANSLALSFGSGDAGMSQQETVLRFTNTGRQSCFLVGFPGVSFVTGDNGQQVGAPAVREGQIGARITVAPGQVASTVIHSVDPEVFDPATCQLTPVRGYRIYPPDDTASMFIPLGSGAEACAGSTGTSDELSVYSIRAGIGDPDQP